MNRRPKAYESSALPLSYSGISLIRSHLHRVFSVSRYSCTWLLYIRFVESETSTNAAAATKTWIYVEPYLFKNASSGRYYSRFFRQGFRALRTNRVTVARLRLADRVRDYKGNSGIQSAAENGDVTMEQVITLFETATVENPSLSASTKKDRRICLLRLQKTWPKLGLLKPRQITDRMHFSGPPDMRVWVGAVDYVYGFGLCVEASSGWREGPAWRA